MTDAHRHVPSLADPNVCAECQGPWNSIKHQPSLVAQKAVKAVRALSGLPEDLQPLAQYERPSGAPFVPSAGAPATHTGRPAQHSGVMTAPGPGQPIRPATPEEVERYLIDNPHIRKGTAPTIGCPNCGDTYIGQRILIHLRDAHLEQWPGSKLADFAKGHGLDPICPKKDCGLTHPHLHPVSEPDLFCDHPNGFGPMGCPCGATLDDPDEPLSARNLTTGEDVRAIRCPVSFECGEVLPEPTIRSHLIDHHNWTPAKTSDFLEDIGLDQHVVVPKALTDAIAAERKLAMFFDPNITMEQLMSDATAARAIDPDELKAAMDVMQPTQLEAVLRDWWLKRAETEAEQVVPKAIEYGSNSLMQVGRKMAQLAGREVNDEEALELGCWSYMIGKVERWTDAVMRGDRPSDDTLHDIAVYVKMAQRIRDTGSWPGL
jgi:hypothetical protein